MWNLYPSTFVERYDSVRKECFVVQKLEQQLLKKDRATMGQRNIFQFYLSCLICLFTLGKNTSVCLK